jgi:predicted transcriptional regulator
MSDNNDTAIVKKLDAITTLLQQLVAIQLAREGVNKAEIGKHLHLAKSTVVKMLKGVGKDK